MGEPRTGAARQVDLGDVARDDHLRAEPEPGEEHLHLLGRGVLSLVEDDEGVVERATAHEGQWRDLDGARGHQPRDRVGVDHVVQGVVERAQIGVDLVAQRPGQEAQPLARFDRRPGEDDPVDPLALQRSDRLGHRQIGLPGAGRADPEDDRVHVDRVDIPLLPQGFRPDRPTAVADDIECQHVGRSLRGAGPQHRDRSLDRIACQGLPSVDDDEQLVDQPLDDGHVDPRPAQRQLVAADMDVDRREGPLDRVQQLVSGSEQRHHRHGRRDGDGVSGQRRGDGGRGHAARVRLGHGADQSMRRAAYRST